ncbi:hypothetical protein KY326_00435 [Candidatus Woesearchaeota archaeon]|nr:hypothetical protein [Candidatus Woesearchaeota archaeon]
MKRGQVTVFIVIGLIFVIAVGILLYFTYSAKVSKDAELVEHFSISVMQIKPYVANCIEQQSMIALVQAAAEAEEKTLPPLEEIEQIISKYLNENIALCANFEVFEEFDVIPGKVNSTVKVQKENFIAEILWPITIKQQDLTISEESFRVEFPVRLNELYLKVSDITDHSIALDVDYLLDQALNIEVVGCSADKIKYVINDKDYMVGNTILQFFFNTKVENLISIFKFQNGIKYLVPSKPGKVVMRHAGQDKRLIFEILDNGFIEGCYQEDAQTEYYTFALVEENQVPASISTKIAKRINIERVSFDESVDFDFTDMFDFSTEFEFVGGTIYLNAEESYDPILLYYDGAEWGIVDSRVEGDYLVADISRLGRYAIANRICVEEEKNRFNIIFVPSDYTNYSKFALHAEMHADAIFSLSPFSQLRENISVSRISRKNDISCLSWQSIKCTVDAVKREASYCGDYDYYIVLIDNAEVGLDHQTKDSVSYIGSYLTGDREFCNTCYSAYEFAKFFGVEDRAEGNRTHIGVPLMAVPHFEPKDLYFSEMYLVEQEKAIILNASSKWRR